MKYREPPNDDGSAVVEATIAEVYALRPKITACLARWGVPRQDRADLFQQIAIVTWMALRDGRVVGPVTRPPEESLYGFMFETARYHLLNFKRLRFRRKEIPAEDPEGAAEAGADRTRANPIRQLEARDVLRLLAARPKVAELLLLAGLRVRLKERLAHAGMLRANYFNRLGELRRWIRAVFRSGRWREPP